MVRFPKELCLPQPNKKPLQAFPAPPGAEGTALTRRKTLQVASLSPAEGLTTFPSSVLDAGLNFFFPSNQPLPCSPSPLHLQQV